MILMYFQMHDLKLNTMMIFTNDRWLKVYKDGTRYVFARPSVTEKGGERVIMTTHWFVVRHLAIGLDTVLQTVKLPAGVTHLDASLANVDRDTLTLWRGNGLLVTK